MKYCTLCKRYVEPTKKFNWAIFLLGLLTFGTISVIYLLYYLFFAKKVCPICGTKQLIKYSPEDREAKNLEKQEKIEKIKETAGTIKDKITGAIKQNDQTAK